jgi:integrase
MPQKHFTNTRVRSLPYVPNSSKQTLYQDDETPGLGLRVTAAGARSYIFDTTLHGETVRETIGDIKTWTLKKARAEATERKTLTDKGIHPRIVRKQKQAVAEADRVLQATESVLVGEVWTAYLKHHATTWGARHLRDHQNLSQPGGVAKKRGKGLTKPGVLYPLMCDRMVDMTAAILTKRVKAESASRANNARQGFELFKAFWVWAGSQETYKSVVDLKIIADKDLLKGIPERQTHKSDVLQSTQLQAWFSAVRAIPNSVISAYLQSLLLTGARRREMAELRWEHIDFRWHTLWVKDKVKTKEGRIIPLAPYVSSLLSQLPRINEWVFSSPEADSGHISEPRIAHDKALATAQLPHVTLQAMRRSFISLAQWVVMPMGIIDQIVGHKPKTTKAIHYEDKPIDLLRVWHVRYEAWMLEQAGVRFKGPRSRGKRSLTAIPDRLESIDPRHRRRLNHPKATNKRQQAAPSI